MSYIHPEMVVSPKNAVSDLQIVYDGKEGSWSLATLKWNERSAVGIRWNGGSSDTRFPGIGNPQSRGVPTWFILPDDLQDIALKKAKELATTEVSTISAAEGSPCQQ